MSIHIRELLPKGVSIKEFKTGSELLLAYELEKYAKMMLPDEEKKLSFDGISVTSELLDTDEFRFVVETGLAITAGFAAEPLAKNLQAKFFKQNLHKPLTVDLKFEDSQVIFRADSDDDRNSAFYKNNRSVVYVSLVAYLMVMNYKKTFPKLVIEHMNYHHQEGEYFNISELQERKILNEVNFELKTKNKGVTQPSWERFVSVHKLMQGKSEPSVKYDYLKEKLNGDEVVFLRYRRTFKDSSIGIIQSCYPAIIRKFDTQNIWLEYYPIIETKLTQKKRIEQLITKIPELKEMFTYDDSTKNGAIKELLFIDTVGIGTCTHRELTFLLPLSLVGSGDSTYQYIRNVENPIPMNTINTIYAIFEDRGIEYNKKNFLKKHFGDEIPIFDQYKSGVDL